jgi:hypothetical protein
MENQEYIGAPGQGVFPGTPMIEVRSFIAGIKYDRDDRLHCGTHASCHRKTSLVNKTYKMRVRSSDLDNEMRAFNSVAWFLPPFVSVGYIQVLARSITARGPAFGQADLQVCLAGIYSAENLAAMVTERYPIVPYIQDYKAIITEAAEAHFCGLGHAAVAGLLPAVEGAGKKLAERMGVTFSAPGAFVELAAKCKKHVQQNNIGAVGEILSMLESFAEFTRKHLYAHSERYELDDKTNRHGILHGYYTDADYGLPINFYKTIAAVDFMCFVCGLTSRLPCLPPSPTDRSKALAAYWRRCSLQSENRPAPGTQD